MSPEQEQLLCDALVNLGPVETEQACTLRASVKSKRSCIAPWPTHGQRSESCACASASRKRPYLSSSLTSLTFGGYGSRPRSLPTSTLTIRGLPWASSLKTIGNRWTDIAFSGRRVN